MRIRTIGLLAGLGGLLMVAPGFAQTTQERQQPRKTLEEVVVDLSAQGYVIREIEMDDDHFEATVVDAQNVVSEAKISGETGKILRLKPKH